MTGATSPLRSGHPAQSRRAANLERINQILVFHAPTSLMSRLGEGGVFGAEAKATIGVKHE